MTDQNFFWLVGILEGEGSFVPGPPSRPNKPSIVMTSTDWDVATRVHRLIGGSLYRRNRTAKYAASEVTGRKFKDIYDVKMSGRPALRLMEQLLPHMSKRRQKRIREILTTCPPIGVSPSAPGKLTAKDKTLIRRKYATGRFTQSDLAAEYGVSQSRISGVVRSESGGHQARTAYVADRFGLSA